MKNEFLTYDDALALKELGFDEPCFTRYYESGKLADSLSYLHHNYFKQINAPLYQQAFRWFREKYNLYPIIDSFVGVKGVIKFFYKLPLCDATFNTYEEAELECLKKLIEIVKNKNK
jgi:hypothetical protein